jgi:hypothetical protein
MADGSEPEGVPVRLLHEALVEDDVEPGAAHELARRAGIGVGLVAQPELPEHAPLGRADPAVDLRQEGLDAGDDLGRWAGGERALEIAARHLVGAEAEIEDAELELHPRKVGVVEEHPLERPNRRLVVARPDRRLREAEGEIEIRGLAQDLPEHGVVLRVRDDALGCRRRDDAKRAEPCRERAQHRLVKRESTPA